MFDVDTDGNLTRRRGRIGDPRPPEPTQTEQAIKYVRKYLRFLHTTKITRDEFNFNLLLRWVGLPRECWGPSADEMPDEIAMEFARYLDDYLIPLDYKPSPTCFMVGPFDDGSIEQKRLELEPQYRQIHEFWCQYIQNRKKTKR